MGLLYAHDWPGNVRQLANVLERAAIMSSGQVLEAADFRDAFQVRPRAAGEGGAAADGTAPGGGEHVASLRQTLEDVERSMIETALSKKDGVQKDAAALLGISPKNLWNKIQKHGIDPARFSGQTP
jgi:two-component system response regulator AtoC